MIYLLILLAVVLIAAKPVKDYEVNTSITLVWVSPYEFKREMLHGAVSIL